MKVAAVVDPGDPAPVLKTLEEQGLYSIPSSSRIITLITQAVSAR